MSKKVVVILSILALVLSAGAVGLWFTVKGKTELAAEKLKPLDEFADKGKLAEHPFEARLGSPAKAAAEISKDRADIAEKTETIAARDSKISGLEKNIKDRDANIDELNTKVADTTRERDSFKEKVEGLTTKAAQAESKVKELEELAVAQNEKVEKEKLELQRQIDADKAVMVAEGEKIRSFYAKLYNYAVGKGLQPPFGPTPWRENAGVKTDGPRFAGTSFLAEVVAVDSRQGFLVLSIGPESGIAKDQAFDAFVGGENLGRVTITSVLNASVTTAAAAPGAKISAITAGTSLRLAPIGSSAPAAPAAAPAK